MGKVVGRASGGGQMLNAEWGMLNGEWGMGLPHLISLVADLGSKTKDY